MRSGRRGWSKAGPTPGGRLSAMIRRGTSLLARRIHASSATELAPAACTAAAASSTAVLLGAAAAAHPRFNEACAAAAASQSHRGSWQLAFAALLGLAGSASASRAEEDIPPSPEKEQGFHLFPLDQRRRVFFKYEKKIREYSQQHKVFEYFASQRKGRSFGMTAGDMMRSVVPVYPPEGSEVIRAGSLPGEPSPHVNDNGEGSQFILKFDIDGDKTISFEEFMLFQTLLSIPLEDLEVAFRLMDKDGSGKVDREEFGVLLDALHAQAGRQAPGSRGVSLADGLHGLQVEFFGAGGRQQLSLDAFKRFVCDLREELQRLEFEHYDWQKKGTMSGRDMAHSIISCARMKHIDLYLDKVQAMPPELADKRFTFADFQQLRAMWRQLRLLSVALEFRLNTVGRVRRDDFVYTVRHVLGIQLSPGLVNLLFYLFADPQGNLNIRYMYEVMDRHYTTGLSISYNFNNPAASKSVWECLRDCRAKN